MNIITDNLNKSLHGVTYDLHLTINISDSGLFFILILFSLIALIIYLFISYKLQKKDVATDNKGFFK